jgi:hypothetical protein
MRLEATEDAMQKVLSTMKGPHRGGKVTGMASEE